MRPTRCEHHDGLAPGEPAADARELPRVADRVQRHQADPGVVVVLPVLQDVVRGDVGVVAGGDERAQPDVVAQGRVQQAHARRRRLAEQPHRTRPRHRGRGGVHLLAEPRVDQAERVGAERAHPVRPGELDEQPVLLRAEVRTGQHDQAVRPLVGGVDDDRAQVGDADGDHREVEVAGHVADRGGVDDPGDLGAVGGDRQHLPAEPAAQHRVDDPAGPVALAVDDDPLRAEQPAHRGGLRPVLTTFHDAHGRVGRQDRELDDEHAVLHALADAVAGVGEDLGHPAVLGQHLGDEARDAAFASGLGQVLEQELGDAATLVGVLDQERDLGLAAPLVLVQPVPAPDADHLAAEGEDQRHPVDVVHLGEALDVAPAQPWVRREEPQVLRLGRHPVVERDQQVRVGGADRPQPGGAAVGQQDVGLPLPRVAGRVVGQLPGGGGDGHPFRLSSPGDKSVTYRGSPLDDRCDARSRFAGL